MEEFDFVEGCFGVSRGGLDDLEGDMAMHSERRTSDHVSSEYHKNVLFIFSKPYSRKVAPEQNRIRIKVGRRRRGRTSPIS